jgi:hypothetical protein
MGFVADVCSSGGGNDLRYCALFSRDVVEPKRCGLGGGIHCCVRRIGRVAAAPAAYR